MQWDRLQGVVLFSVRAALALIFLWHGVPKAFSPDVGVEKFVNMGFPGFLGPIVGWVEVVGSILLVVGWGTRWASLVLAGVIAVAILGVQLPQGYQAGLERDLMILVSALALAVVGPGALSLDARRPARVLQPDA